MSDVSPNRFHGTQDLHRNLALERPGFGIRCHVGNYLPAVLAAEAHRVAIRNNIEGSADLMQTLACRLFPYVGGGRVR